MDKRIPQIKIPKINIRKPDLSKVNLRKFNWLTVSGIMAYLNILVLIPLIFTRKSPFVQYHVRQGILVLAVTVILSFTFYFPIIPWIFAIFILICIIVGIINVATGRERPLPLIGKLAIK